MCLLLVTIAEGIEWTHVPTHTKVRGTQPFLPSLSASAEAFFEIRCCPSSSYASSSLNFEFHSQLISPSVYLVQLERGRNCSMVIPQSYPKPYLRQRSGGEHLVLQNGICRQHQECRTFLLQGNGTTEVHNHLPSDGDQRGLWGSVASLLHSYMGNVSSTCCHCFDWHSMSMSIAMGRCQLRLPLLMTLLPLFE